MCDIECLIKLNILLSSVKNAIDESSGFHLVERHFLSVSRLLAKIRRVVIVLACLA